MDNVSLAEWLAQAEDSEVGEAFGSKGQSRNLVIEKHALTNSSPRGVEAGGAQASATPARTIPQQFLSTVMPRSLHPPSELSTFKTPYTRPLLQTVSEAADPSHKKPRRTKKDPLIPIS